MGPLIRHAAACDVNGACLAFRRVSLCEPGPPPAINVLRRRGKITKRRRLGFGAGRRGEKTARRRLKLGPGREIRRRGGEKKRTRALRPAALCNVECSCAARCIPGCSVRKRDMVVAPKGRASMVRYAKPDSRESMSRCMGGTVRMQGRTLCRRNRRGSHFPSRKGESGKGELRISTRWS